MGEKRCEGGHHTNEPRGWAGLHKLPATASTQKLLLKTYGYLNNKKSLRGREKENKVVIYTRTEKIDEMKVACSSVKIESEGLNICSHI